MKKCFRCQVEKPLDSFHKGKNSDGKHSWCKACVSKNRKLAYQNNPDSRTRDQTWSRYRLRPEGLADLIDKQGGKCAICESLLGASFKIDHDHSCCPGQKTCGRCVRGLLCHRCNVGVGMFNDDHKLLTKTIEYLSPVRMK